MNWKCLILSGLGAIIGIPVFFTAAAMFAHFVEKAGWNGILLAFCVTYLIGFFWFLFYNICKEKDSHE